MGRTAGIDELTKLVRKYMDSPSAYKPEEMRACLDSFRDVLFRHLDQEVRLSADVVMIVCGTNAMVWPR